MSQFDENNDIFSGSPEEDEWGIDTLLEETSESSDDLYSSSTFENSEEIFSSSDPEEIFATQKSNEEAVKQNEKEEAEQKKNEKRRKKKNKKKKRKFIIPKIILSLFLVVVISFSLIAAAIGIYITSFVEDELDFNLNNLKLKYTSMVYGKNSETGEWEELVRLHGSENREWVDYTELSPYLTDAIVSIEDKRFYEHDGVDWKRTAGAFVNTIVDIYGGTQGGSTITQQLIKNLTGDDEQTASRKIQEIVRARKLEQQYHKSVILECYVNTVHFGNGCDGIQTAAAFYFGKEAKELTLLECASLAATIQTPNVKNPLDGPKSNKERREACLSIMLEEGYITKAEYDAAKAEELVVIGNTSKQDEMEEENKKKVNSYFMDTLIDDVISDLMAANNCTQSEATDMLYSGGYRIYSTLDPSVQAKLEETFLDETNFPENDEGIRAQAAQTIMDYTGHIVAIVGGVGEKEGDRSWNRAYHSTRQPGSSIKPLSVYAPGVETNLLTYSSLIHDYHIQLPNGSYYPKAAGSGKYVTTQKAIQSSLNSTAVQVCNTLTPNKCFDFLKKRFGISTIVESEKTEDGSIISDINLSAMALGGMAHGVKVTELTAAYAAFGNLGLYYEPTTYYAIYDPFGDLVLQHQSVGSQIISPDTANIMNRLMQTVITQGTGGAASLSGWSVFGKTGTTDNKHDCWFAGGTPYYVSVLWCGYDSDHDLPGGANPSPAIWKKTMAKVMEDLEPCDFNQADNVVCYEYCKESGGIAKAECKETAKGYYKEGYPAPPCTLHQGEVSTVSSQPKPKGDKFADISQVDIPEADAFVNQKIVNPLPEEETEES